MRAIAAEEVLREPRTLFLVGSYSIGKVFYDFQPVPLAVLRYGRYGL